MSDADNVKLNSDQNTNETSEDPSVSSAQAASAGSSEQSSLTDELKSELAKYKNDYLYLRAEFDNFRKQSIKERSDLRKYASERIIVELLDILDVFETALKMEITSENAADFRKGVELISHQLHSLLSRHGVEEIPAHGLPFDPNHHEAISSEETEKMPSGHITQVFKKPYKLHERVIRPGQVVVAKPKS